MKILEALNNTNTTVGGDSSDEHQGYIVLAAALGGLCCLTYCVGCCAWMWYSRRGLPQQDQRSMYRTFGGGSVNGPTTFDKEAQQNTPGQNDQPEGVVSNADNSVQNRIF